MKIQVYTKTRGIRVLKDGVTLQTYQSKFPDAIRVYPPTEEDLMEWEHDGGCETPDGCWVEPDGTCEHGQDSWLLILGYI